MLDFRWLLNPMRSVLMRQEKRLAHKGEIPVKTQAVIIYVAKSQRTPRTTKNRKNQRTLESLKGVWHNQHLNFRPLPFQTVREISAI